MPYFSRIGHSKTPKTCHVFNRQLPSIPNHTTSYMINPYYRLRQVAILSSYSGLLLLLCTISFTGCTYPAEEEDTQSESPPTTEAVQQDALDKGIAHHGGLDHWQSFGTLQYAVDKGERTENHLIDLHKRRTLQTGESFQLGFDGTDAWVTPGLDAYSGKPRFAIGLDFYFFAIPFVLADPGTNRDYLGRVSINDMEYEAVKISFDTGIGGSPNDYYIAHFDPDTYQLKVLLYTATYFSQESSESYNAKVYEEWTEVEGLLLPTTIAAYRWNPETRQLEEKRGSTGYSEISLSKDAPEASTFAAPEGAEFDRE